MRKITFQQIAIFFSMAFSIVVFGILVAQLLLGWISWGSYHGVVMVFGCIFSIYVCAFLGFRIFWKLRAFPVGEITHNSREETSYHVYLLFLLIFFYPILRSGFVPVPVMRLVYQVLGARLGENTYSSGIILDPPFIRVGDNTLIGQYALLVPHVIENERLAHYPINIGSNVTIGAHAVVLSDVTIEDGALVATGAVVPKGTHIRAGEIWGGVPAKKIKSGYGEKQISEPQEEPAKEA